MATHSSILDCRIQWAEESGGLLSMRLHRVGHDWSNLACIGEGNGNPLLYSWLENPRDRGAWWAAIYGVAQSQTRLKQLSRSSSSSREKRNRMVGGWLQAWSGLSSEEGKFFEWGLYESIQSFPHTSYPQVIFTETRNYVVVFSTSELDFSLSRVTSNFPSPRQSPIVSSDTV